MTENTLMTNDVFTNPVPAATVVSTPAETFTGTVADLVGEGKKYKTVEALAASVVFKDEFIETLKREKQELLESKEKLKAEEVFDKLINSKPEEPTQPTVGMTPEAIQKLVSDTLLTQDRKKVEATNIQSASNTLINHFGDQTKATEFVTSKAAELGLSVEFLMSTAARSPVAFLNVVGISGQPQPHSPKTITSSVNPASMQSGAVKYGSKEYFNNIYKTSKAQFLSAKVQLEMQDAALKGLYV